MQVQTEVTQCTGTSSFCVCGIAVRAGGDVFVINRCPGVTRNVFAFKSCIDDILDVRKIDELNYKVHHLTICLSISSIHFSAHGFVYGLPLKITQINRLTHINPTQ